MSKDKGFSSTSANRYSLALYELAAEANVLPQIETNVLSIMNLIEKSDDFKNLIKDPTVSQSDLSNAIDKIFDYIKLTSFGINRHVINQFWGIIVIK